MNKKNDKVKKINFISLTKKYWKEQFLFYVICTLSSIGSFLISENGTKVFIKKMQTNSSDNFLFFFGKKIKNFGNNKREYLFCITLLVFAYFTIVFIHVWFSFYLRNKIRNFIKKIIVNKLFTLKKYNDGKEISSLLTYNIKVFSEFIFYIPNQIYYVLFSAFLNIFSLSKTYQKNLNLLAIFYFFFIICCLHIPSTFIL